MAHRPIITLTTDFGLHDHFVGTLKGVILDIVPEAEIVDICHSVQVFEILDGALTLAHPYEYFLNGWWLIQASAAPGGRLWRVPSGHNFVAPEQPAKYLARRSA